MCLAIPAKIIAVNGDEAVVETNGVSRKIIVALIKPIRLGDYVLVHAGFAIRKWTEDDVREYNAIVGETDAVAVQARSKHSSKKTSGNNI